MLVLYKLLGGTISGECEVEDVRASNILVVPAVNQDLKSEVFVIIGQDFLMQSSNLIFNFINPVHIICVVFFGLIFGSFEFNREGLLTDIDRLVIVLALIDSGL